VGDDVMSAFADRPHLFHGRNLDLWEANREALVEAGVPPSQIEVAAVCTQCHSDKFFSHRANGGQPAGRFAGLIRLC
jgi:copper oxidase (laccase) domain-containing protein